MSILGTSPSNIVQFNVHIANDLKDAMSAILIEHLLNLSLPLPEQTIFTKETVRKILFLASVRETNKAIRNLERIEIFEKSNSKSWIVNIKNLVQYVERVGGMR